MDFFNIMNSIGVESMGYEAPMNEIDEMNAEIALESELDRNFAEMEAMNTIATIGEIEVVSIALSERELALESTGRTAEEVYRDFGLESVVSLEAIKDVAARKYYGGVANLKALINKCIAWVKNLIGMGTSIKKVMASLKKKADNQIKALRKLASKNMEKLKREMPTSALVFIAPETKIFSEIESKTITYNAGSGNQTKSVMSIKASSLMSGANMLTGDSLVDFLDKASKIHVGDSSGVKTLKNDNVDEGIKLLDDSIDKMKQIIDASKEVYTTWKDNDNEYEEGEVYSHVMKLLQTLKSTCEANKNNKSDTNLRKMIDGLEKVRDKVNEKANAASSPATGLDKWFTKLITLLNLTMTNNKNHLKTFVRSADDILTHGKGVEAALA